MKTALKYILGMIIGIVLILVWLSFIDIHEVLSQLQNINYLIVILSLVIYTIAFFLRSLRWNLLLKPIKNISISKTFRIFMAGNFVNFIIPVRAGELAKSYFLKKESKIRMSLSLPTVFMDKLMELAPIILILTIALSLNQKIPAALWWIIYLVLFIFVVGVITLFIAVKNKNLIIKMIKAFTFFIPKRFQTKIYEVIDVFIAGFKIISKCPSTLFLAFMISILVVITDALYFTTMFLAFGKVVPFILVLFGYTLFNLSFILPTPPAQLGSNEVILFLIFSIMFSLEKNLISAMTLFSHVLTGIIIISLGTFFLSGLKLKKGELEKATS